LGIAYDLREQIARGELRAGEDLPVESDLMEQLGVSKGVIREALRILETEGLVEVRRGLGGGPRVRHPSISEASLGVGVYLQIGDVLVTDVWEARDRIIGNAVERLASNHTDRDVATLESSVQELAETVGDFDAYYVQLLDVGEKVVYLAGNTTDYVLVVALRHIIAAELEAATRAVVDVGKALAAEKRFTGIWRDLARQVKAGHARVARRSYDLQADIIRNGLAKRLHATTIVDIFRES
jgi:GntR family transcriptional regulator, transcriptional repressor for pyruvate dehydrogenase complex